MAARILAMSLIAAPKAPAGTKQIHHLHKIGTREVVGYGWNGQTSYADRVDYPFPAIRFREDTSEVKKLREKEKLDWKKLSIQEKKALYRSSFCQTFAEVKAPSGEWKQCIGYTLIVASLAMGVCMWMNSFSEYQFTLFLLVSS